MESNLAILVPQLYESSVSNDLLDGVVRCFQQDDGSLLISQSFDALLLLHQWIWQSFTHDTSLVSYYTLIQTVESFDRRMISDCDQIDLTRKTILLFSFSVDEIDQILNRIRTCNDENDRFISVFSGFFDNLSYLLHANPIRERPALMDHLAEHLLSNFIITDQCKTYLKELRNETLSHTIFTARLMFYMRSCSFYIHANLSVEQSHCSNRVEDILHFLVNDYLAIVRIHSRTVASWNEPLLGCITHILGLVIGCCCCNYPTKPRVSVLSNNEMIACNHADDLILILTYQQQQQSSENRPLMDTKYLIDSIVLALIIIAKTQTITWFLQSKLIVRDVLMKIAENAPNEKISLRAYAALGAVLTNEQLKELNVADGMVKFFFHILEEGWAHPSRKYQRLPISHLLIGFEDLFKSDSMQQKTADLQKMPLFISMCDDYPVVYDILWTLSFNADIQQQLHSQYTFIEKLFNLAQNSDHEQMRKTTSGILWNLGLYDQNRRCETVEDHKSFDIMISYSHKDKQLCKQVYDELVKRGYRVWIDFDQMHGNVMDAMAQAIEQSHMIIICMSEDYRRSNFCRAEAHYAFQRQLKIVPILLQKHYKPDGWLLFLIGQLLYVDFAKHEFTKAMNMLFKELEVHVHSSSQSIPVETKREVVTTAQPASPPSKSTESIVEWSKEQVQDWLIKHGLTQMSRLLKDCDGRSVLYLHRYLRSSEKQETIGLLDEDAKRRLHERLSLIELCQFQSLLDRERQAVTSLRAEQDS